MTPTRRQILALGTAVLYAPAARAADPLTVYTVNYPLAWFAGRIGGDAVRVHFPAPAGADPEFWRPSIAQIGAYQKADLIVLQGGDYAGWTKRASLPRGRIVETTRDLQDRLIVTQGAVTHSHGAEGAHSHSATASTTWLDFDLAAAQAARIAAALAARLPDQADAITARAAALSDDLAALQSRARALGTAAPGVALIASHPRYQYFARVTGFDIRALTWAAGALPDAAAWADLDTLRATHPARVLIWEAAPPAAAADELARRGLTGTVFDPCAQPPATGDFLSRMQRNLDDLAAALAQG